jgi:hypothetical protein
VKYWEDVLGCRCREQLEVGCQNLTLPLPWSYHGRAPAIGYDLSPTFIVQPTYCSLKSQEVQYFDRFRNQIVYQLGSHSFDDFWHRTVLRESTSNDGVLDTILGIGALAQALEGAPLDTPLYRVPLSNYSTSNHYAGAIRYYTRSLVKLRRQISSSEREASPRTLLISTILFSAFELLQGNLVSSDKHMTSGVSILKDIILQSTWPDKKSRIATTCDDEGIEDAEFILMRRLTFKCLLSPSYSQVRDSISACIVPYTMGPSPPDQTQSFEVFWKLWMRFLTLALMWHVRVELPPKPGFPASEKLRQQQERRILLSQTKAWEITTQAKLDQERDPYGQRILKQIIPGLKTLHFFLHTVFYESAVSEIEANGIAREINDLAESILEETPLFQAGLGEVYEGIQVISMGLVQRCRDLEIRSKAMSIGRKVLNAQSRWDGKEILMGTSALFALEEAGRDSTGSIPLASRYDWISAYWNDDHAKLTVTFESRAAGEREHRDKIQMTLCPEDYGLV